MWLWLWLWLWLLCCNRSPGSRRLRSEPELRAKYEFQASMHSVANLGLGCHNILRARVRIHTLYERNHNLHAHIHCALVHHDGIWFCLYNASPASAGHPPFSSSQTRFARSRWCRQRRRRFPGHHRCLQILSYAKSWICDWSVEAVFLPCGINNKSKLRRKGFVDRGRA